ASRKNGRNPLAASASGELLGATGRGKSKEPLSAKEEVGRNASVMVPCRQQEPSPARALETARKRGASPVTARSLCAVRAPRANGARPFDVWLFRAGRTSLAGNKMRGPITERQSSARMPRA